MSLVLKSNQELLKELNRRKSIFSSYRIGLGNVNASSNDLNTVSYLYNEEEVVETKPTITLEPNNDETVNVENTTSKVIDLQDTVSAEANSSGTRKYNQSMRSGYFGKRRAR